MSRRRARYNKVFTETYGEAPWPCDFCQGEVESRGLTRDSLVIHHRDEDHMNDTPENLGPAHRRCHSLHHQPEGQAAAHGYTPEIVEKIAAKKRGVPHLEAQLVCECGKECHAGPMKRHHNHSGHSLLV